MSKHRVWFLWCEFVLCTAGAESSRCEIFHRQSSANNSQKSQCIPFDSVATIDAPSKCTKSFAISHGFLEINWKNVSYHKFILLFLKTRETWKEIWQLRSRAANFTAVDSWRCLDERHTKRLSNSVAIFARSLSSIGHATNWTFSTFSWLFYHFIRNLREKSETKIILKDANKCIKMQIVLENANETMAEWVQRTWGRAVSSHIDHIEVVELIDSSGRITLCIERELKERKANKKKTKFFFPVVYHRCERKTNRHICCLFVFGEICDFSFFDSQFSFQQRQNNADDNSIHKRCSIVLLVILFVF